MQKKNILIVLAASLLTAGVVTPLTVYGVSQVKLNDITANANEVVEPEKSIKLTFPANGGNVHILKPNIVRYIAAMHQQAEAIENDYILHDFYVSAPDTESRYGEVFTNETDKVNILDYYPLNNNIEKSKEVVLTFDRVGFEENTTFTVSYSLDKSFLNAKEVMTTNNYVSINNLLSGTKYYWKVTAGGVSSRVQTFYTDDGFRMITAPGVNNIRDMGGRPVSGGKHIKQGLIFRGGELVEEQYTAKGSTHGKTLYDAAKVVLQDEIEIKYEIDLRGDEESNNLTQSPLKDEQHNDVDYIRIPDMKAYDYFFKMSRSDERWPLVKEAFLAFKNAEAKHVYFHCWGGADRTGTMGFVLGGLLGMSYTDLVIDYELTTFSSNYRPHDRNDAKKVYRFPSMIAGMRTSTNASSEPYYSEDKTISQIIEEVLIDRAGLTAQDIADIKANLLED